MSTFKEMKLVVREFFQMLWGLNKIEMERAARYILHLAPTTKRYWNYVHKTRNVNVHPTTQ